MKNQTENVLESILSVRKLNTDESSRHFVNWTDYTVKLDINSSNIYIQSECISLRCMKFITISSPKTIMKYFYTF